MRCLRLPRDSGLRPGDVRFTGVVADAGSDANGSVWIDVPEGLAGEVVDRLDPWLLWLLPYAFETQQELVLQGPVDSELLRNAERLMEIWSGWRPERRPVAVRADAVEPSAAESALPRRTGLFFTGGADSYFSLLHRDAVARVAEGMDAGPRGELIDDLAYVWGFDIPLRHAAAFEAKRATLARIANEFGKTPICLTTNLRETGIRQPWGPVMHGPALGGAGLLLGRRWRRVVISSFRVEGESEAWGSTPLTDALLSTARTRAEPYGWTQDRLEKLAFVAQTPIALETLHVCWEERSERNCGRCEKCFRTLLALEILGLRERASSFPKEPLDLGRLAQVWKDRPIVVATYVRLRTHALEAGRHDVASAIDACISGAKAR